MLEQSDGLLIDKLDDHVAEYSADGIESFIRLAYIVESLVIEEDLLDDKDSNSLAELRACLHDAKAQRDDLSSEQEVDNLSRIILDKSADNTKRSQAQVFEGAGLGGSIQERVEEKRNVCYLKS